MGLTLSFLLIFANFTSSMMRPLLLIGTIMNSDIKKLIAFSALVLS